MFKKVIISLGLLSSLALADFYELKPIKITKDITCVIGDINPPMKSNNGFVSNMYTQQWFLNQSMIMILTKATK